MATTYNIWFGVVGSMALRESGLTSSEWDLPFGELDYGVTYEWRVDSINDYGTTYGKVWEFTSLVFAPPNDVVTVKRIVAAANDTIFFQDG